MVELMTAARNHAVEQRRLATVLRDLGWTIHRLLPEVAGLEPLSNSELAVVKQVLSTPGVTGGEISRRLGMRQSNVSAAVRGLVERGLVERERSAEDRRITWLLPTEKSLGAVESIAVTWSKTLRSALSELTPEQADAIESATDALRALDTVLREGPGPES
ncbi:MarR family transcriptional regulator [Streptomyces sp. NPDC002790]|uniref:MarR family winged helix-turn-helix transcriptional regulator n=1 Tax=Streptomyces sp. NPDC002790 TaxID=3154431 RepID=UPI00331BA29C